MSQSLHITEIFHSLQGESSFSGKPCTFVRLTGCNLRCVYCDTEYSFYGGTKMTFAEIIQQVDDFGGDLVCITGGEPLLQKQVGELAQQLLDKGYTITVETGGSLDIDIMPDPCIIVLDIKTPSSKMEHKNLWDNIAKLTPEDEVKFVIGDKADYDYAVDILKKHDLTQKAQVLFSPVVPDMAAQTLADWILADKLNVRFQLQLHKLVWGETPEGSKGTSCGS